jgi:hypothetical protein
MRAPTAGELASPGLKIANWDVVSSPQRGDIAAYKLSGGGTSYSGHSGIVTSVDSNGFVHAVWEINNQSQQSSSTIGFSHSAQYRIPDCSDTTWFTTISAFFAPAAI